MVSKVLLLSLVLLAAGAVLLVAASLGWWSSTQCVPPSCTGSACGPAPSLCWTNPNPDPSYAGVTFVVGGLALFGSVALKRPKGRGKPAAPPVAAEKEGSARENEGAPVDAAADTQPANEPKKEEKE